MTNIVDLKDDEPIPFLWLDEYERETEAPCGCRLAVKVEEPKGTVAAAFYQCERHAEVNEEHAKSPVGWEEG